MGFFRKTATALDFSTHKRYNMEASFYYVLQKTLGEMQVAHKRRIPALPMCPNGDLKKGGTQCRKICCPDIWGQKKHPTSGAIPRTPSAAGASRGRSPGPSKPHHAAPGSSQRMPGARWSKRRSTAGWSKLPQGCAFLWLIPQNPSDKPLRSGSFLWKNRSYTFWHRRPSYSLHRAVPVPGGT